MCDSSAVGLLLAGVDRYRGELKEISRVEPRASRCRRARTPSTAWRSAASLTSSMTLQQQRRAGSVSGSARGPAHDPGLNTIRAITIAKLTSSSRETRKSRFIRARSCFGRWSLGVEEFAHALGTGSEIDRARDSGQDPRATASTIQVLPKLHAWRGHRGAGNKQQRRHGHEDARPDPFEVTHEPGKLCRVA